MPLGGMPDVLDVFEIGERSNTPNTRGRQCREGGIVVARLAAEQQRIIDGGRSAEREVISITRKRRAEEPPGQLRAAQPARDDGSAAWLVVRAELRAVCRVGERRGARKRMPQWRPVRWPLDQRRLVLV